MREAEALARRWSQKSKKTRGTGRKDGDLTGPLNALQEALQRSLGTKVLIVQKQKGKKGKIEIEYYSPEDLDRIVDAILGDNKR